MHQSEDTCAGKPMKANMITLRTNMRIRFLEEEIAW